MTVLAGMVAAAADTVAVAAAAAIVVAAVANFETGGSCVGRIEAALLGLVRSPRLRLTVGWTAEKRGFGRLSWVSTALRDDPPVMVIGGG